MEQPSDEQAPPQEDLTQSPDTIQPETPQTPDQPQPSESNQPEPPQSSSDQPQQPSYTTIETPPVTQPEPYQPPQTQQPSPPLQTRKSRRNRYLAVAAVVIIACSLFAGVLGYYVGNLSSQSKLSDLQRQVTALQDQLAGITSSNGGSSQVIPENVSLSTLYNQVKDSVVVITDTQSGSLVEGSGFIDNLNGRMVVVTNNHVISGGTGISVTFSDGDGYSATVLGADPYADLAVLSTSAPSTEFHPLQVVNSSVLAVGDFVAAIGSPFGLAGSMTTGIVSALGRTITESTSNYAIADVIQFSAPINPGNSGGPLLNAAGEVVGINTAGIENGQSGGTAQGVGFAISSKTILREINSLVDTGSYSKHSYMGVSVVDNSYDIASQEGIKVTYGVLVESVVSGGPSEKAGLKAGTNQVTIDGAQIVVGGDVIIAINGARIVNQDDLSTYLAENTQPGQTINITVERAGQTTNVQLTLDTRPAPG